jgi:ankyrin repeat protein
MTNRVWLLAAWLLVSQTACAQDNNGQLAAAVRANDISAVARSLDAGADPNFRTETGTPMLVLATNFADTRIAKQLLEFGARVDLPTSRGRTALHSAANWGRSDLVTLYVDRGANANAADVSGATPLHSAVYGMQYDVIDVLAKRGANVNAPSKLHATPLIAALRLNARNERVPTLVALLRQGADPNAADSQGNSSLHLAIRGPGGVPSIPAIKVLLDFRASATAANSKGETPIALAAASGDPHVLALFTARDHSQQPKGLELKYPIGESLAAGERKLYTIYVPYEAQQGGLYIRLKLAGQLAGQLRLESPGIVANTLPGAYWMRIPEGDKELSFHLFAPDSVKGEGAIGVSTAIVDTDGQATHATHLQMIIGINQKQISPSPR